MVRFPDGFEIVGGGDTWSLTSPDGITGLWDPETNRWVDQTTGLPMPDEWTGGHRPPELR